MPRPDDYPIPDYAVYLWIAGGEICINFPPTVGRKAHTVRFPATELGMAIMLQVLRERPRGTTFSTKAEPTQYALERAMVNDPKYAELLAAITGKRLTTEQERQESEAFLAELGL